MADSYQQAAGGASPETRFGRPISRPLTVPLYKPKSVVIVPGRPRPGGAIISIGRVFMDHKNEHTWYGTTVLTVRKGKQVVIAGDGQVSIGDTVIK